MCGYLLLGEYEVWIFTARRVRRVDIYCLGDNDVWIFTARRVRRVDIYC